MQQRAVQAEKVEGVIYADGGSEDGESPAKFEACGAVDQAVGGINQGGTRWTQPVGKEETGAGVEESGAFDGASERNAVFEI